MSVSIEDVINGRAMTEEPAGVGARVRALRERAGWTQGDLSDRSGVRQNTISSIETGETPSPTGRTLGRIADALGVTVDALMGKVPTTSARAETITISQTVLRAMLEAWLDQWAATPDDAPTSDDFIAAASQVSNASALDKMEGEALIRVMNAWLRAARSLRQENRSVTYDDLLIDVLQRFDALTAVEKAASRPPIDSPRVQAVRDAIAKPPAERTAEEVALIENNFIYGYPIPHPAPVAAHLSPRWPQIKAATQRRKPTPKRSK